MCPVGKTASSEGTLDNILLRVKVSKKDDEDEDGGHDNGSHDVQVRFPVRSG